MKKILLICFLCYSITIADIISSKHGLERANQNNHQEATTSPSLWSTTKAEHVKPTLGQAKTVQTESNVSELENSDIFGCRWPDDFRTRMEFCLKRAKLEMIHENHNVIKYGIFDHQLVDKYFESMSKGQIYEPSESELKPFVDYWQKEAGQLEPFSVCLRENSEGMVKLCGPQTRVGKVLSGDAGMQLNLLNIVTRTRKEFEHLFNQSAEDSFSCVKKLVATIHYTVALYLTSDNYKENAVLCWNKIREPCDDTCAKFALQLGCLSAACANITDDFFRQFGIWEWYYMGSNIVRANCKVETNSKCQVSSRKLFGGGTGESSAIEKITHTLKDVKTEMEKTFHQPISIIASVIGGGIVAFIVFVSLCCCWYHGACCFERKRKKIRYASLLPQELRNEETKALAQVDPDDFE